MDRNRLDMLGEQLREAEGMMRAGIEDAYAGMLRMGRVAREAKAVLPHGQFTPWVRAWSTVQPRQVRRYMAAVRSGKPLEQLVEEGGLKGLEESRESKTVPETVLPPPTEAPATGLPGCFLHLSRDEFVAVTVAVKARPEWDSIPANEILVKLGMVPADEEWRTPDGRPVRPCGCDFDAPDALALWDSFTLSPRVA